MSFPPIVLEADLPVFDPSRLLDQFGGEPEILVELRDLFLQDFPQQLERMQSGIAAGDADAVARAAHSLKGASGTFGAERVFQVALAIEHLAREGQLDGVTMGLDLLRDEWAKVVQRIQNLETVS